MIQDNDPYRLWVYSLHGEALHAALLCSIPPDKWSTCSVAGTNDGIGSFMEYEGWPLKMYEGTLNLSRTSAGNVEFRWNASWCREVFGPGGPSFDPRVMQDHADAPDAEICLSRLWLLAVENMSREARSKHWDHHFRSFMRHVACHIPSPDNLTPAKP